MSKRMRKIFYFLLELSASEQYCNKSFKKESEQSKTLYGKQLTMKNPVLWSWRGEFPGTRLTC